MHQQDQIIAYKLIVLYDAVEILLQLGVVLKLRDSKLKDDALLEEYAQTLIEYIEYYLRFEGVQGDMVSSIVDDKLEELGDLYYLASYAGRRDIIAQLNAYYRTLGVSEDSLVDVGDKPRQADSVQIGS